MKCYFIKYLNKNISNIMSPVDETCDAESFFEMLFDGLTVSIIDPLSNIGTECTFALDIIDNVFVFYRVLNDNGNSFNVYIRNPFYTDETNVESIGDTRMKMYATEPNDDGERDEQVIEFNSTETRDYIVRMINQTNDQPDDL